jgi:nucleotide-binding universal stress UspA family protein
VSKNQKIVWLVDPLTLHLDTQTKILDYFSDLSQKESISIEPLYVYGSEIRSFKEKSDLSLEKSRMKELKLAIERLIPKKPKSFFTSPTIINSGTTTVKEDTTAIINYLNKSNADSVVINTSNKKNLTDFWIGSFTQSLLEAVNLPVMLFSPHTKYTGLKAALIISNFSESQKKTLSDFILKDSGHIYESLHLLGLIETKAALFNPANISIYSINLNFEKDLENLKDELRSNLRALTTLFKNKVKAKITYSVNTIDFIDSVIEASDLYKPDISITIIDRDEHLNDPRRVLGIARNINSPILILPHEPK